MAELKSEQINVSDILPYDFVRENEVIASFSENGYELISPHFLKPSLYHEIQRYLKSDFKFEICSSDKFNELLTNLALHPYQQLMVLVGLQLVPFCFLQVILTHLSL